MTPDLNVQLRTENSTSNPDEAVVRAARGDYSSESLIDMTTEEVMDGTDKSRKELIEGLLRSGHFGPFEHATAYFHVEHISRVAMAQITRHRLFSFDVQSQRYVNFSDKEPVIPSPMGDTEWADKLKEHWEQSVEKYDEAIDDGVEKEHARFFLPQATPVNMTFSANARSLMHFEDLRNNAKAQKEARDFAQEVLDDLKEWAPLTFNAYEEYVNNNSLRAP